jgi:uncharacterized membrane protein
MREEQPQSEREELEQLVRESNDRLVEVGSEGAEQSFGLGCMLGGLLVSGLVGVLFMIGLINIIMAMIMLAVALVALTALVTLTASYARSRRVGETYRLLVGPEIERSLKKKDVSYSDFHKIADELLGEDAPLRVYLVNFETDPAQG